MHKNKTKKNIKKTREEIIYAFRLTGVFLVFILAIGVSAVFLDKNSKQNTESVSVVGKSPEIQKILEEKDIDKQIETYTKLIKRVGPVRAQEELHDSGVPFTGPMHLLNHTAGDIIWKTEGPAGVTKCRDYFSSSCYHGFILNAIGDGSVENINPVLEECRKKGTANYAQCAHAVGHGLLAYAGYANLIDALSLCDEIKAGVEDFVLGYCYNGVFMENIWGLHDGAPSAERWVSDTDIRYPCNDERLEERHLPECWYNQALHITNAFFHGDLVKVAKVCETIEKDQSRYMCYDATFRSIHSLTEDNIKKKFEICRKMPKKVIKSCIAVQASAAFQQGDRSLPFEICSTTNIGKERCYSEIVSSINFNINSGYERDKLCDKIPTKYRSSECGAINSQDT